VSDLFALILIITTSHLQCSGIYYYDLGGAFNGLLFKDFVLQGMEGSYWFYVFDALGARVGVSTQGI